MRLRIMQQLRVRALLLTQTPDTLLSMVSNHFQYIPEEEAAIPCHFLLSCLPTELWNFFL